MEELDAFSMLCINTVTLSSRFASERLTDCIYSADDDRRKEFAEKVLNVKYFARERGRC